MSVAAQTLESRPMDSPEQNAAAIYDILRNTEAGRSVDQFRSLPQANQYRNLYSLVARHMRPGARVLDWACGNGHFSFFLARQGAAVTSFGFEGEPAVFSLLTPQERARITYVQGSFDDPLTLPFGDASFECAFSVGVLEHVRETGGTEIGSLREMRRVLQPGGRFICYHLPNRYSYIEALQRTRHRGQRNASTEGDYRLPWLYHQYRYTKADIQSLCEAAGLSVLEIRRYGAIPRNILGRLPGRLRDSRGLASAANAVDGLLELALSPIAQNYAFVAARG